MFRTDFINLTELSACKLNIFIAINYFKELNKIKVQDIVLRSVYCSSGDIFLLWLAYDVSMHCGPFFKRDDVSSVSVSYSSATPVVPSRFVLLPVNEKRP